MPVSRVGLAEPAQPHARMHACTCMHVCDHARTQQDACALRLERVVDNPPGLPTADRKRGICRSGWASIRCVCGVLYCVVSVACNRGSLASRSAFTAVRLDRDFADTSTRVPADPTGREGLPLDAVPLLGYVW